MKDVNVYEDISIQNYFQYFLVDESNFIKNNGELLWVIGILNSSTYKLRLGVSKNRDENILKKFITRYVKTGNYIVSDGWNGYHWLSRNDEGYIHSVHSHGHGLDSTSHIKGICFFLKNILEDIYFIIPKEHFILFLREAELRRNINNMGNQQKWNEFIDIFKNINDIGLTTVLA